MVFLLKVLSVPSITTQPIAFLINNDNDNDNNNNYFHPLPQSKTICKLCYYSPTYKTIAWQTEDITWPHGDTKFLFEC